MLDQQESISANRNEVAERDYFFTHDEPTHTHLRRSKRATRRARSLSAPMQVWIHKSWDEDGEAGCNAWALTHIGFATWAETEPEVLRKVPSKLIEYLELLKRHGVQSEVPPTTYDAQVEVVERVEGNEIVFSSDFQQADAELISKTLNVLRATRSELLSAIRETPDALLDWDPPYRHFHGWAKWRTIRQILAHISNTETHYYLPNIGIRPEVRPADDEGPWADHLEAHRDWTEQALVDLTTSSDLARVRFDNEHGAWSVRKSLRRLVWHERLHTKSIRRIMKAYWQEQNVTE